MNYTLIVTHGRTGSTLLQGILNSIDGWHIKGENFNFAYDLFCSYQSLLQASEFKDRGDSLSPEFPWFGVASYNLDSYAQELALVIKNTLMSGVSESNLKCLGFKEIRYFDLFLKDSTGEVLGEYLNFLTKVLNPCKLIFLQRNLKNVLESGWWADEDKDVIGKKLAAFSNFLSAYTQQNQDSTFCISYETLVNKGEGLYQLFSFLEVAPLESELNRVLLTKHSYNIHSFLPYSVPSFSSEHPDLLIQANQLHANKKYLAAKKLYKEFVNQYEQGEFNRLPLYASVRAGRQAYIVRTSKQYKIAYFPIPKSACTSVSQMLYQVINGTPFVDSVGDNSLVNIHEYFDAGSSELSLDKYTDFFKFTVIRDPIERFISAYRNRIIHHGDLDVVLDSMDVPSRPSINEFAMNLEGYIEKSLLVEIHFQPIYLRLGHSLNILDKVFPIEEIKDVPAVISKVTGQHISLPHVQTGGPKYDIHSLSKKTLEKLINFYRRDYELLADYYSSKRIREIYGSAKSSH